MINKDKEKYKMMHKNMKFCIKETKRCQNLLKILTAIDKR